MRLSQIVALVGPRKENAKRVLTENYQTAQKPQLFVGQHRTYSPVVDGGERLPSEAQAVQARVRRLVDEAVAALVPAMDTVATQDLANCKARGTLAIGEVRIDLPVTHLLYLEKQLADLRTFIDTLPELPQGDNWTRDEASGLWQAEPTTSHRTSKVQKPLVLYHATEQHPAQTQIITEDVTVGHWATRRYSGGIPRDSKKAMLARLDEVVEAVKAAREEANTMVVVETTYAKQLLAFIFG